MGPALVCFRAPRESRFLVKRCLCGGIGGADLEHRLCPCDRLGGSINNVARLVLVIRIAGDAAALIGRDLILVDHPFKRGTLAKPIRERFRLIYPICAPQPIKSRRIRNGSVRRAGVPSQVLLS